MDHGGEAARPTTVEYTNLGIIGAVQGGEENMRSGTFHGQVAAAADARRAGIDGFQPSAAAYHGSTVFAPQVRSVPVAVFWHQPGPVGVVLVSLQLPGGVMPVAVHDNNYGYSDLQTRPGAGRGVVLVGMLPGGGGTVHNGDYRLQPRPGTGHSELLVDQLPDGAGLGEAFVGLLLVPGGVSVAYDDNVYYVLVMQPHPGAGHGEVLPDGVRVVFGGLGDFVQQTLPAPGTRRADGIAGALRYPNLGTGYDGSGALADDLGAVYNNRGMVSEHLRRLLPFVGIGASSVAINGLAAGPRSPAVAFQLFVLLLGGLFVVLLHVLLV